MTLPTLMLVGSPWKGTKYLALFSLLLLLSRLLFHDRFHLSWGHRQQTDDDDANPLENSSPLPYRWKVANSFELSIGF